MHGWPNPLCRKRRTCVKSLKFWTAQSKSWGAPHHLSPPPCKPRSPHEMVRNGQWLVSLLIPLITNHYQKQVQKEQPVSSTSWAFMFTSVYRPNRANLETTVIVLWQIFFLEGSIPWLHANHAVFARRWQRQRPKNAFEMAAGCLRKSGSRAEFQVHKYFVQNWGQLIHEFVDDLLNSAFSGTELIISLPAHSSQIKICCKKRKNVEGNTYKTLPCNEWTYIIIYIYIWKRLYETICLQLDSANASNGCDSRLFSTHHGRVRLPRLAPIPCIPVQPPWTILVGHQWETNHSLTALHVEVSCCTIASWRLMSYTK